jgi:hypothetical protein
MIILLYELSGEKTFRLSRWFCVCRVVFYASPSLPKPNGETTQTRNEEREKDTYTRETTIVIANDAAGDRD